MTTSLPPGNRDHFGIDIRRVLRARAEGRLAIIVAGVVVVCALLMIFVTTKII